MKKVFVQACDSQGCGMVVAKAVLLLTQQVAFGKIIVKSYVAVPFQRFLKSKLELISVCNY